MITSVRIESLRGIRTGLVDVLSPLSVVIGPNNSRGDARSLDKGSYAWLCSPREEDVGGIEVAQRGEAHRGAAGCGAVAASCAARPCLASSARTMGSTRLPKYSTSSR